MSGIGLGGIQEGKYTTTVYSYIRDGRYLEVIRLMKNELGNNVKSRAALSLLA
jgi:tetratricopeptide repeat protein 30